MKEVKGKRLSEEVIDGGKRRAGADSRLLMMKSCVRCASVDPLMKGKQQRAFPSLALISPLSGGVCCEHTEEAAGWRETLHRWKEEGVERKGRVGVGGFLSFVVVNACM